MHLLFLKLHWNWWLSKSWVASCFCNCKILSIYNFGQIHHQELWRQKHVSKHIAIFSTYKVKYPTKCMINISIFFALLFINLLGIIFRYKTYKSGRNFYERNVFALKTATTTTSSFAFLLKYGPVPELNQFQKF